ncbi:MAG TPA: cyclodeaminase/cyclohydrolase family protein [Planctomycetota bacterium]|nr:cyclodeaminase/cyclohydrolase family protein [Planctomycetota bacterium]
MIHQSFEQLVESLAAKTPTPGGGAAAAMAGCMGTALFLMVVRFSRGKKANVDREGDLARVETMLADYLSRLLPMADRDCRSFDLVSAAYGMKKDTDDQRALREKAIQEAMVGAMVVPEETQCMVRDVFVAMESVVGCIGKAIISDLASGAALLLAAAEGAYLNVRINAAYLTNRELADRTNERAVTVRSEIRRHQEAIASSVDKMLA